jgi:hypothetical protein
MDIKAGNFTSLFILPSTLLANTVIICYNILINLSLNYIFSQEFGGQGWFVTAVKVNLKIYIA